jgi:hypothetical protein
LRASVQASAVFRDDFSNGASRWRITDSASVRVVPSGDPSHGNVLELVPNGARVHALVIGSVAWRRFAVEGEMLFPDPGQSYLGFIWGYRQADGRSSYGNMYVKGNDSYLQVNPHWDDNPIREMYPEYTAALDTLNRIRIGQWKPFRIEVVDSVVHFYVGAAQQPNLTFDRLRQQPGEIGFRPRVVGSRVWIDNIRVRHIARLTHPGSVVQELAGDRLITQWEFFGPLDRADDLLELGRAHDANTGAWTAFSADGRGAVVAAQVLDYLGPRTIGYFRTTIEAREPRSVTLRLASLNQAAIWLNGRFMGHAPAVETAWRDIAVDSTRPHIDARLRLRAGTNTLVLRLRGGQYASGGFYAALVE